MGGRANRRSKQEVAPRGEARTVFVAIASRMIVVPALVLPFMAWGASVDKPPVFEEYVLCMTLPVLNLMFCLQPSLHLVPSVATRIAACSYSFSGMSSSVDLRIDLCADSKADDPRRRWRRLRAPHLAHHLLVILHRYSTHDHCSGGHRYAHRKALRARFICGHCLTRTQI